MDGEKTTEGFPYATVLRNRYKIFEMIHEGAHGRVYEIYDSIGNEWLVLKEYTGPDAAARSAREASILQTLDHRYIARFRERFAEGPSWCVVKDRIAGYTLETVVRETGPQAEEDVRRWMLSLCDVMEYLHSPQVDVVYADLKPGNAIVDADRNVWLFDFDAAIEGCATIGCKPGRRLFTPAFAAPELSTVGKTVDRRADIYSAGILIWSLLAGTAPPNERPLPDIRTANPDVCSAFAEWILPLCTKMEIEDRLADFTELRHELEIIGPQRSEPVGGRKAVVGGCLLPQTTAERDIRDIHPTILMDEDGENYPSEPIPEPTYLDDVRVGDILVLKADFVSGITNHERSFTVLRVERSPSRIHRGSFEDTYVCQGYPDGPRFRFFRWMIDCVISENRGVSFSRSYTAIHLGTQRLETGRLILRRGDMRDAEPMFRNWASDRKTVERASRNACQGIEAAREHMSYLMSNYWRVEFYDWLIELKEIGEAIGTIGLEGIDADQATFKASCVIGREWWGQGIAAEALEAIMEFAFEKLPVKRIIAQRAIDDAQSKRVLQKCGMRFENTAGDGDAGITGGTCRHSITREEYKANRGASNRGF